MQKLRPIPQISDAEDTSSPKEAEMEDFIEDLEELVCRVSDAAEGSMTALVTISKEKQDLASINEVEER
jgi:hypothetical protein